MMSTWCTVFGCVVLCVVIYPTGSSGTKCYRSEVLGEREGNVYFCEDSDKPECCDEGGQFTCCEEDSDTTLREQLILWGVVLAVILLITLGCCYFWKDCACCKDDRPRKCCCCCHKPQDDEKAMTSLETARDDTSYKPQWPPRPNPFRVGEYEARDTETPPPFKFKTPTAPSAHRY